MFFVRLGTVIAWIVFVMGLMQFGFAAWIIFGIDNPETASFGERYFGSRQPSKVFSEGLMMAGGAVVLGILASIARSVHRP
jgi:hypothetical protein